jgi:hypothetical protein
MHAHRSNKTGRARSPTQGPAGTCNCTASCCAFDSVGATTASVMSLSGAIEELTRRSLEGRGDEAFLSGNTVKERKRKHFEFELNIVSVAVLFVQAPITWPACADRSVPALRAALSLSLCPGSMLPCPPARPPAAALAFSFIHRQGPWSMGWVLMTR